MSRSNQYKYPAFYHLLQVFHQAAVSASDFTVLLHQQQQARPAIQLPTCFTAWHCQAVAAADARQQLQAAKLQLQQRKCHRLLLAWRSAAVAAGIRRLQLTLLQYRSVLRLRGRCLLAWRVVAGKGGLLKAQLTAASGWYERVLCCRAMQAWVGDVRRTIMIRARADGFEIGECFPGAYESLGAALAAREQQQLKVESRREVAKAKVKERQARGRREVGVVLGPLREGMIRWQGQVKRQRLMRVLKSLQLEQQQQQDKPSIGGSGASGGTGAKVPTAGGKEAAAGTAGLAPTDDNGMLDPGFLMGLSHCSRLSDISTSGSSSSSIASADPGFTWGSPAPAADAATGFGQTGFLWDSQPVVRPMNSDHHISASAAAIPAAPATAASSFCAVAGAHSGGGDWGLDGAVSDGADAGKLNALKEVSLRVTKARLFYLPGLLSMVQYLRMNLLHSDHLLTFVSLECGPS